MPSKPTPAYSIALGGVLAALAVVIMGMGTLIPVATYACPMICMLLLHLVLKLCGRRIAWAWYGAVSILSLLQIPNTDWAAARFCSILLPRLKSFLSFWQNANLRVITMPFPTCALRKHAM